MKYRPPLSTATQKFELTQETEVGKPSIPIGIDQEAFVAAYALGREKVKPNTRLINSNKTNIAIRNLILLGNNTVLLRGIFENLFTLLPSLLATLWSLNKCITQALTTNT
jgi:hypothetical protein